MAREDKRAQEQREEQPVELSEAVTYALEEARMILPGIQALFGFQLIAVFNERFSEVFDSWGQWLHVAALVCVALACALAMTPAAYHRQNDRSKVSRELLNLSSVFIGSAMIPLLAAISIDVGLVAYVVSENRWISIGLGGVCAIVFVALWLVFPRRRRLR
jgi:membrane protein YdbS with pleckstrin-like domain